jgi:quercetin dioxygenase-like cupin family protein
MCDETPAQRADRILSWLRSSYPGRRCYDVDGRATQFVCEVEPVDGQSGYDTAVEVIISSSPHKHERATQRYQVLKGTLELHLDDDSMLLHEGDTCNVKPGTAHWATSEDEAVVEIRSKPGWNPEDHLPLE